jgi:poly(A) polymerase Pap1
MAKYKATKNLFFKSLNKDVIVGEIIELEKEYADKVNADLANVFPDTDLVLEPLEKVVEEQEEKPKRTRKKATEDAEPEK